MLKFMKQKNLPVYTLILFYVLQIIPILYLGQFNHPTSDDFLYGAASHETWTRTGSLAKTIWTAIEGVKYDYQTWQGSFSALFFMRLEPTVFGEWCYALVPYMMIGLLTFATLYFVRTLFVQVLQSDSLHFISVSLLILMLSIQFSPVASEQFFWYNSSVYYNAFHAFMLMYLAWICRYVYKGKKRCIVYMAVFGVIIGGGNYVTALTLAILMALSILGCICSKTENWKRKALTLSILWAEFIGCFIISAMAPGNAIRGETTLGYGAVSSIFHSLVQGTRYYAAWLDKWWVLVALMLLPIFVGLIKKTRFRFQYPVLVLIFTYGIFSAMSCPTFYALGSTGPGRIINIIYDSFLLFSYGQLFYITGYCCRKVEEMMAGKITSEIVDGLRRFVYNGLKITIALWIAVLVISGNFLDTTTITACKVWIKGEGKQYDMEYKQRLAVLEDESITDVVFAPYTVEPELVFIADGTEDPEFVNNREWADFYGKNSLVITAE